MGLKRKTLVLGAKGLLGSTVCNLMNEAGGEVFRHSRYGGQYSSDLNDLEAIVELLLKVRPDVIYNFAALADVDKCEDPQLAYIGNVKVI